MVFLDLLRTHTNQEGIKGILAGHHTITQTLQIQHRHQMWGSMHFNEKYEGNSLFILLFLFYYNTAKKTYEIKYKDPLCLRLHKILHER